MSKYKKIKIIYKEEGLFAVLKYSLNFLITKIGWSHDHWFLGRLVEMRGNMVKIDCCFFNLDSPMITTVIKSKFFLGKYEEHERKAIRRFLDPSFPVIELGASIGVVSCITNKKLKNPKNHVVVEANPDLIPLLEKNRDLNNCSFVIINKALGYYSKEIIFFKKKIFSSGGVKRVTDEPISVPTITLAEIFNNYGFPYANLICDIEGGEVDLVSNEIELLSKKVFQIIIEVHAGFMGEEAINNLREQLQNFGFSRIRTGTYSNVLVFENSLIKKQLPKI